MIEAKIEVNERILDNEYDFYSVKFTGASEGEVKMMMRRFLRGADSLQKSLER